MTCKDFDNLIIAVCERGGSEYLTRAERTAMTTHVMQCASCGKRAMNASMNMFNSDPGIWFIRFKHSLKQVIEDRKDKEA